MRRGDIYYAKLLPAQGSEQAGTQPVVVVSRDAINENSPVIIVVPLTDRRNKARIYPSQVVLKEGEGNLPMESAALGEQVRAISKAHLGKQLGRLSDASMASLSTALKIALDLP